MNMQAYSLGSLLRKLKGVRLWRRIKTNRGEHGMCPFTIMIGLVRIAGKLRGDLRPNGKQQSGNGISV